MSQSIALLFFLSAVTLSGNAVFAEPNEVILRRLDRLERENAALRQEVHQLRADFHAEPEVRRSRNVKAPPSPDITYETARKVSSFRWTGARLGLFGGGALFAPYGSVSTLVINSPETSNALTGQNVLGSLVGVSAGYDWQSGALVYGLEADFARVFSNKFQERADFIPPGAPGVVISDYYRPDTVAALRAKVGVSVDRALIYGTAGVGTIHGQQTASLGFLPYPNSPLYLKKAQWTPALAIGGGVDYALSDHWVVGAEALYLAALAQNVQTHLATSFGGFYTQQIDRIGPSQTLLNASIGYKF